DAQGRIVSATTLTAADLPPLSASAVTSGTLAVVNGGTGTASFTNNGVLVGSGATALSATAAGTQFNALTVDSADAPTFGGINLASANAVSGLL
ncbi:hypothetical protein ACSFB5_12455, partial [Glaesserella parasuis]|uniref:hypothetical protein n=1 Tax=Glaesserella parasuis TaxID=738 RepID=UPI003F34C8E1